MKKEKQRFESTGHPGIRKDLTCEFFEARKQINGKQYRQTFKTLTEACHWMKYFHPGLTYTGIGQEVEKNGDTDNRKVFKKVAVGRPNGTDQSITVKMVWELYEKFHLPQLEKSSVIDRKKLSETFLNGLFDFKMIELNANLLDLYLQKKAQEAHQFRGPRRKNFNNELKFLKSLLNWYRENYDEFFINPVLKRHKVIGTIVKDRPVQQKMTLDKLRKFLDGFEDDFWRDLAETQFFLTARVQDVAGLQVENIFFEERKVELTNVTVWDEQHRFWYLKGIPKNGHYRWAHINDRLHEIFSRRMADRPESPFNYFTEDKSKRLDFVFHLKGQPLGYRQIQYQYNKALKRAGLEKEFSSTHFLRKAMAKATRDNLGLDAAQAVGGWRDRKIVEEIYTDLPQELCIQASKTVENLLYGSGGSTGPVNTGPQKPSLKIVR